MLQPLPDTRPPPRPPGAAPPEIPGQTPGASRAEQDRLANTIDKRRGGRNRRRRGQPNDIIIAAVNVVSGSMKRRGDGSRPMRSGGGRCIRFEDSVRASASRPFRMPRHRD